MTEVIMQSATSVSTKIQDRMRWFVGADASKLDSEFVPLEEKQLNAKRPLLRLHTTTVKKEHHDTGVPREAVLGFDNLRNKVIQIEEALEAERTVEQVQSLQLASAVQENSRLQQRIADLKGAIEIETQVIIGMKRDWDAHVSMLQKQLDTLSEQWNREKQEMIQKHQGELSKEMKHANELKLEIDALKAFNKKLLEDSSAQKLYESHEIQHLLQEQINSLNAKNNDLMKRIRELEDQQQQQQQQQQQPGDAQLDSQINELNQKHALEIEEIHHEYQKKLKTQAKNNSHKINKLRREDEVHIKDHEQENEALKKQKADMQAELGNAMQRISAFEIQSVASMRDIEFLKASFKKQLQEHRERYENQIANLQRLNDMLVHRLKEIEEAVTRELESRKKLQQQQQEKQEEKQQQQQEPDLEATGMPSQQQEQQQQPIEVHSV